MTAVLGDSGAQVFSFQRECKLEDTWRYYSTIMDDNGIFYVGTGDNITMADHNALYAFASANRAPPWRRPICLGHILSSKEGNFEVVGVNDESKEFRIKKIK